MSPALDALLCARYPELFADRHQPMAVTAMCWGFTCDDGWFDLIDELSAQLQAAADTGRIAQPVAMQVKQKFGALRFYVRAGNAEIHELARRATEKSLVTCEVCGRWGTTRVSGGLVKTTCAAHALPDSRILKGRADQ